MPLVDYYLKIDGIDGESTKKGVEDWIELLSFNWGANNTGSMSHGGGGTGRVSVQDFCFTMSLNKATPKLFLACAIGDRIKHATLICRKAGTEQQAFYTYKFSSILVSAYDSRGEPGEENLPVETVHCNFSKVEVEYRPQSADGSVGHPVKGGYDLKKFAKV